MGPEYTRNCRNPPATADDLVASVAEELAPDGLLPRGFLSGGHTETEFTVLVGNAGPKMWQRFGATGLPSLDAWTKQVIDRAAANLGASAIYPSDGPPYAPFHSWALATGTVHESPIGLLIDPVFGLWHAYRAALTFEVPFVAPPTPATHHPCTTCIEKPCLTGCPVGAFRPQGFDAASCRAHVTGPTGDCGDLGCAARRACPVGIDFVYEPEQAAFHMAAFTKASRPD